MINFTKGNIFNSEFQTITIPVNTVGVMGKGLALEAKNRYSDLFFHYRKLCQQQELKIGRPQIYRGEEKWFLLFPTKGHWRESSTLAGIEQGLQWVLEHYRVEGITSLAVPALGCGLGGLPWPKVSCLMYHYFSQMQIPVSLYLPYSCEKNIKGHASFDRGR